MIRSRAHLLLALLLALLFPALVSAQDGWGFGDAQGGRSGFGPAQGTSAAEAPAWTPADATGLVLWWDLTSADNLTLSGADVTGVTDLSGNGHDLNVVSATEPTFAATTFGESLGGVTFVAASGTFLARNSAPVTAAPFQVYVVAKSNDATAAYAPFFIGDKDVAADFWGMFFLGATANDPVGWQVVDTSTTTVVTSAGYTADTAHLLWALETSSVSRAVRLDGGNEGTNTTDRSPDDADRIGLGALLDSSPAGYLNGAIAEVVLLNTASTADRAAFHAYFAEKYGITIAEWLPLGLLLLFGGRRRLRAACAMRRAA